MGYKHFSNKECEYYPCHTKIGHINCLFCFCPLYHILDCEGDYTWKELPKGLKKGVKDCSKCTKPHTKAGWDFIMRKLKEF